MDAFMLAVEPRADSCPVQMTVHHRMHPVPRKHLRERRIQHGQQQRRIVEHDDNRLLPLRQFFRRADRHVQPQQFTVQDALILRRKRRVAVGNIHPRVPQTTKSPISSASCCKALMPSGSTRRSLETLFHQ